MNAPISQFPVKPRKARVFKFRSGFGQVDMPWFAEVPFGRGVSGRHIAKHPTWQEAMDWVHEKLASAT
jgi:hypothetical protein